jgi:hypothetical protein
LVAAFFDEEGNFVGSRATSNMVPDRRPHCFFVAIVVLQDASGPLLPAGWRLATLLSEAYAAAAKISTRFVLPSGNCFK